jgi:histidinol-phosphate aminotransferase
MYICNPNNPSGTVVDGASLREFCLRQSAQTLVVIDEAYLDLVDEGATDSMVDLVRSGANVVVLRTFSKIHGLAGLRIGYAIARPDVAARLRRSQMTFPSIIGLRAALASLGDKDFLTHTRNALIADRRRFAAFCDELRLHYAPPQGNFIFVDVGMPADEFRKRMRTRLVEVGRPFEPLTNYSRITIGTTAETTACIAAMREALKT